MKKRLLSYCCVFAMLLCLLPQMAANAADEFTFTLSHMVHYTQDTSGNATVMTTRANSAAYQADFVIADGDTVRCSATNVAFSGGKASYTYDVDALEKKVYYTFTITVHDAGGTEVARHERALMKFDRPTALDETGRYIMNGKEFKPVIGYHVDVTDKDYALAKQAGFNVIQMGFGSCTMRSNPDAVVESLALLEKYDLYGLFCPYMGMLPAGNENNLINTRSLANALKDNERVFAWGLMDEPFGETGPFDTMCADMARSYFEIRKYDDTHPAYICDYNRAYYAEDLKYCDVFAPDIYSRSEDTVQNYAARAVSLAGTKPVYPIVRTYGYSEDTTPQGCEIQHYVYQALAAGARGHGYFSFTDAMKVQVDENTKVITPLYELESRWNMMLAIADDLPVLQNIFTGAYTDETGTNYLKRTWENGICMVLSKGGSASYFQPCSAGTRIEFLAGDRLPTEAATNGIRISLPQWGAAIYKLTAFDETGLLFEQNGQYVSHVKSGTVRAVYPRDTGAAVFLQLIQITEDGEKVVEISGDGTQIIPKEGTYKLVAYAWNTRGGLRPLCKKAVTDNVLTHIGL